MKAILILTSLTFREAMRRRMMLVGLVVGSAFLLIYSLGLHFILVEVQAHGKRVLNIESTSALLMAGLYAVTFLSVAMAALLAADTLAGEINSGTIQTTATKPIRRSDIVLGKWLGFSGLLGLYLLLMAGGTISSTFLQTRYLPDRLLVGVSLIYLEALLIMTITLLCSSAFPALATGGIVFGLYGLALIGGWVEQIGAVLDNQTAIWIGTITSLIMPSESLWRRAIYEMQTPLSITFRASPFGTSSIPSPLMIAYSIFYLMIALLWAVRIFQQRDL